MTHRKLGRYLLVERLRTGGMAEIWRGLAEGPGGFLRKAAIKVILPAYADDEDFLEMFMDEAAIAARLTHANIAQIHDFSVADGTPYLAMEFVEGKDLKRILKASARQGKPIPWPVAAAIGLEVAKGLYYVHTLREDSRPLAIVHRDISPQNLMVSYSGEVKIVDFGIARAAKRSSVTRLGEVKGKCAYMSPEQALGRVVDARADQFSLGVVLWELLTGRRLFGGGTPAETVARLVKTVVPSPHEVREDLPPELSPIVTRALARAPSDRYPNLLVFYETLSRFLHGHGGFPGPHRLAEWLRDLFPDEVEAYTQGEGEDGLQGLEQAPIRVTELDTGEWKFLQDEPEGEPTRPMGRDEAVPPEAMDTAPDRPQSVGASSPSGEEDFLPWDQARPETRRSAASHPALNRTSASTVALYIALAFLGAGMAVGAWAWILGLGPFETDPMKQEHFIQEEAPAAGPAATRSLAELDLTLGAPDVIAGGGAMGDGISAGDSPPSVDCVDTSPNEGGGCEEEDVGRDALGTEELPPSLGEVLGDERSESPRDGGAAPAPSPKKEEAAPAPSPKEKPAPSPKEKPAPAKPSPPIADPTTFGTIHVTARPYAQVRVDGRFKGVAPKDLRLAPGKHVIELEYLNHRHVCNVDLEPKGEARCEHSFAAPEPPPSAP